MRVKFAISYAAFGALLACVVCPVSFLKAAENTRMGAVGNLMLDTTSLWRFMTVRETREVVLGDGTVGHFQINTPGGYDWLNKNPEKNEVANWNHTNTPSFHRLPSTLPDGWTKPGFDDSAWARLRAPILHASQDEGWKLIMARGLFEVKDPERAGALTVNLTFRGGAVVYINGEEVGRAYMPEGEITDLTPAVRYPEEAYVNGEGYIYFPKEGKSPDIAPRIATRTRTLVNCKIKPDKLRKGVNVLAVAIHRAPTDVKTFIRRAKGSAQVNPTHQDTAWAKIGLSEITLIASAGAAVTPNISPTIGRGFVAWNQSIIQRVFIPDYPDPFSPLNPITMVGVRNGTFAGQVIVGHDEPITALKAVATELKGPGVIPVSAVQVRYALADGDSGGQSKLPTFDSLEEFPPEEVPVYPVFKEYNAEVKMSVVPIWVTVSVPTDAKAGQYEGSLTITAAEAEKPVTLPIKLTVLDWTLPDPHRYSSAMDLIQSPETQALAYDVPMWSEKHLALLDKAFSHMKLLAARTLYITACRRTHFGNEHALVRWVRNEEGDLLPEFSHVEKYLDVAMKHLGKIPAVIFYAWEPPESQGHAGGAGGAARTYDRPLLITAFDPASGKESERKGPAWGTPESLDLWTRFWAGVKPIMQKRGIPETSVMLGLIGDARATKQSMDDISMNNTNQLWAVHSHYYCPVWQGYKMGMINALWGIGYSPIDPSGGYSFGWSSPEWLNYYPRELSLGSTLVEQRTKLEKMMGAKAGYTAFISKGRGPRGLGRLGADFWSLRDARGRKMGSLAGRYPESAWGQLNLNFGLPYLLGMGRNGPLATVRSETFRLALQELEARVYLEKAYFDPTAATRLGDDLLKRIRTALDERIRVGIASEGEGESFFISSDWGGRTQLLFSLAAEVSGKFGGNEPQPDMKPMEPKKR